MRFKLLGFRLFRFIYGNFIIHHTFSVSWSSLPDLPPSIVLSLPDRPLLCTSPPGLHRCKVQKIIHACKCESFWCLIKFLMVIEWGVAIILPSLRMSEKPAPLWENMKIQIAFHVWGISNKFQTLWRENAVRYAQEECTLYIYVVYDCLWHWPNSFAELANVQHWTDQKPWLVHKKGLLLDLPLTTFHHLHIISVRITDSTFTGLLFTYLHCCNLTIRCVKRIRCKMYYILCCN